MEPARPASSNAALRVDIRLADTRRQQLSCKQSAVPLNPGHDPMPLLPAPATPPRLRLAREASLLHGDGRTLVLEHKDALMLAYLVIEGRTPRASLAALLWPDVDETRARGNLRQRLLRLRQTCGTSVVVGTTQLSIADHVVHDLTGSAGVLGNMRLPELPAGDDWLCNQRERRSSTMRRGVERQLQALEQAGDLAAALPVAEALLRLAPLSEAAHRRVMRLHYLRGDRAEALLAFDRCERTLKDDVGTKPSGETLALLQTIEQAQAPNWLPGQALPASVLRPPRLIGRTDELAALARAWLAEQAFVATGPAGTGKSRLLDAIADADASLLLVRARPGDDKVPLATLDRLVHRLAQRWPVLGALPAYARFLARLAGPGQGQSPTVQAVTPVVAALIEAARAKGLGALVLDDLQFADEASADIWQELLMWPSLAGLRFGFASRLDADAARARVQGLGRHSDVAMVPLQALPAADVQAFVESLGLSIVDAPALAGALARRIGGNPLHLLETIRNALELHGQLRADMLEAPARVAELIERRLVALPADGLLLVRIAAVAGNHFDPELAAVVSRRDVLELADAWHGLESEGLLDARGFMHDLIGEAALRLLPQPIARVLHARVAAHLTQRGADAARLAYHLLCAGDDAAAVPHLANAARQAWHLGRSREMREAYLRAAEIELARGQPDVAFDLLFDCAEAITEIGPTQAFGAVIERLALLAHLPVHAARVSFMQALECHYRADYSSARAGFDRALALAAACGDRLIEAECRVCQAVFATHDGHLHDAIGHLMQAVSLSREIGREQRAVAIEVNVQVVLLWIGQARLAQAHQRTALQRVLDARSNLMLTSLTTLRAETELRLGDVGAARLTAGKALQAMHATDLLGAELATQTSSIAGVLRGCGCWDEALDIVNDSRLRMDAQADVEQTLSAAQATIYLDLGRPDLAHRLIEAFAAAAGFSTRRRERALGLQWRYALATAADFDAGSSVVQALESEHLLLACELMLAAGSAPQPEPTAAQCAVLIARCEPEGLREQLAPLHALCARLHAREGDAPAARASVERAEQALLAGELGAAMPQCHLWLAQAWETLGRPAQAAIKAQQGAAWLAAAAQRSVPAEFRDSFMHGNPVHRDLQAAANRLGARGADAPPGARTDRCSAARDAARDHHPDVEAAHLARHAFRRGGRKVHGRRR